MVRSNYTLTKLHCLWVLIQDEQIICTQTQILTMTHTCMGYQYKVGNYRENKDLTFSKYKQWRDQVMG